MDLKGACTLLSLRPEDVGLFGMLLTGDLVYFQIAGIFGWAGTPAAFQVVTRAIQWELEHRLQSSTLMYVDDIIGVGMVSDISADLKLTRAVCTSLLGTNAVADDKTEVNRRIEVIGYVVDLDIQRVLIAKKNYLNALHGFISINLEGKMTLRTAQKLASWVSRYGKICRVMTPTHKPSRYKWRCGSGAAYSPSSHIVGADVLCTWDRPSDIRRAAGCHYASIRCSAERL